MTVEFFIVTNNPKVAKNYPDLDVYSLDGSVLCIFQKARDYIHRGHRLLTHPLSGSLKPGRVPYKTVLLTAESGELDLDSLRYIESSIESYRKTFPGPGLSWTEQVLGDHAEIDISHVEASLGQHRSFPEEA